MATEIWEQSTNGDNDWHCKGVDFGETLSRPIKLVHVDPRHHKAVFKVPGGTHWSGRGQARSSHGATYRVLSLRIESSRQRIVGDFMVEFPVMAGDFSEIQRFLPDSSA